MKIQDSIFEALLNITRNQNTLGYLTRRFMEIIFHNAQTEKEVRTTRALTSYYYLRKSMLNYSSTAAWAAAKRAIGTRNGEQEA